jgi:hypothetical protein
MESTFAADLGQMQFMFRSAVGIFEGVKCKSGELKGHIMEKRTEVIF